MAGKLVQVATETITSTTASVDLIGTTTDDVYLLTGNNLVVDTDARQWNLRVLKSSSPDVTSNYDYGYKQLRTNDVNFNGAVANATFYGATFLGTAGGEDGNFIAYLYHFNDSSEYSYISTEESSIASTNANTGTFAGIVHTVASASNGIRISCNNGTNNFTSGTFTLYKVI
jgi:hypothetical protein